MKLKPKKVEELVMDADDDIPVAEEVVEVEEESAESPRQKKKARILTLGEIADDAVYGIHCYCYKKFGTEHRPALGSEIRRVREKSHEYGVVKYYAPNTRGLTETGTLHRAPKGNFLIKLADDFYCAAENYMGVYTPETEEPRRVFHFGRLTAREQRVLTLRRQKQIRAEQLAAKKKRKPSFKFKKKG